jgi:exopolysaccharide biosynthesis polyprenyl glycosylphosphotransferase
VTTQGHQERTLAPPARTPDVSSARAGTLPEGLEEAFHAVDQGRGPVPAPPRARPAVSALMTGRGLVITTIATDALMLLLAVGAALLGAKAAHISTAGAGIVWLCPPLVIGFLALRGMYRPKITLRILDEAAHVVGATSVAAMAVVAVATFFGGTTHSAELLARVWVFGMVYVAGGRLVIGLSHRHARALRVVGKSTLIVGAGRIGAQVERRLDEQPELGLRPVGYVDAHPPSDDQVAGRRAPLLGGPDELERIVRETGAEHVVLAFLSSRGSDARLVPIVRQCDELGLEVSLVPRLFESINVRVGLEHIGGMPLFRLRTVRPKGWQFAVKHALDRVMAAALIVMLGPVLLGATLALRLSSRGPIFFRQRRVGRDGRDFDLLKFRSMRLADDPPPSNVSMFLPSDTAPGGVEGADRRTAIGKLMRRTSIDELPQLFNVLRGQMSIVGPRPERPEFVELFERRVDRYEDRHRVKSGITGWAQVHGLRGKTSLSDRIELDNFYIENWSLWLDVKILVMTVGAVFQAAE